MASNTSAFFYPVNLALSEIQQLLRGYAVSIYDVIDFPDEAGGEASREFAVPLLPGMDEIEVEEARIVLRAQPKDMDIEGYSVHPGPQGKGIYLELEKRARLRKVELQYETPNLPGQQIRVVVRQAERRGSSLQAGPPVFASPDFPAPGPMFSRVLTGMTLNDFGGGRKLLTLTAPLSSVWLIQVATGNDAAALTPLDLQPRVNRVVVEALPHDLAVTLDAPGGGVPLWSHPDVLLPETGEQEVSFTPLAGKHLNEALKQRSSGHTLPLVIRFTTSSGGAVAVSNKTLRARYVVRPMGNAPTTVRLGGDRTPLVLEAPAGLRAAGALLRLTAKLLGRELNSASPEPPLHPAPRGLRVTEARGVAASASFAGPNRLVSVRILAAMESGEAVLEVRADAAGAPGALIAQPAIKQVNANHQGWLEFELPQPVMLDSQTLWLAVRLNKGELYWLHGVSGGQARITPDRGQTWAAPTEVLVPAEGLAVQLFHSSPEPFPPPVVRLEREGRMLTANLMAEAEQKTPAEYVQHSVTLPAEVTNLLATTPGQGRVPVQFHLFSRQVLDLTVDEFTLYYDPFEAGGAG
jgi:hypothetical protein